MTPGQAETLARRVHDAVWTGDPESAHGFEDELRSAVLRAIADGGVDLYVARELAKIALRSDQLDFPRRCA